MDVTDDWADDAGSSDAEKRNDEVNVEEDGDMGQVMGSSLVVLKLDVELGEEERPW